MKRDPGGPPDCRICGGEVHNSIAKRRRCRAKAQADQADFLAALEYDTSRPTPRDPFLGRL